MNILDKIQVTETKTILELNLILALRPTPGHMRLKKYELNEKLKSIMRLNNKGQLLWKILDKF